MVATEQDIWQWLEEVKDPEIPVLTVVDMGVIRKVTLVDNQVQVTITPTYSGCPAMDVIESEIKKTLEQHGIAAPQVDTVLSPAWTTDWLTAKGRQKLKDYGIAPPEGTSADKHALFGKAKKVTCPHCGSKETVMKSQFGSTPCKSLYVCNSCKEPFDYFKCI